MSFKKQIIIDEKEIGGKKTFIIAEIGSNHNQDINLALELIDVAVKCEADAVKFQSIKPEKIYVMDDLSQEDKDLLNKIRLDESWYKNLRDYCKKKNILFFSSPTYIEAIDLLIKHSVKLMKIASPQTYGFPQLIEKVGETGLPTIMSTGYCTYEEIQRAIDVFKKTGNTQLILLYCVPNYPTSPENVNLNIIDILAEKYGIIPGFSDHALGYHITVAAVAKGAKVIEKHLTLSRDLNGPDHYFALEPEEFKEMVKAIRDIEKTFTKSNDIKLRPFELDYRKEIEMRICAKEKIDRGEMVTSDKIMYLRNKEGLGISSWDEDKIIGKKTEKKINKYDFLKYSDFN